MPVEDRWASCRRSAKGPHMIFLSYWLLKETSVAVISHQRRAVGPVLYRKTCTKENIKDILASSAKQNCIEMKKQVNNWMSCIEKFCSVFVSQDAPKCIIVEIMSGFKMLKSTGRISSASGEVKCELEWQGGSTLWNDGKILPSYSSKSTCLVKQRAFVFYLVHALLIISRVEGCRSFVHIWQKLARSIPFQYDEDDSAVEKLSEQWRT